MKKTKLLVTAIILTIACFNAKAQLANGSIAPDWTLTDINGVSHNLYTDLNSGKTVYIDVSATWCGPCWAYHNTGALDDLWTNHGPTGGTGVSGSTTNDVMVYYIEGDGSTNSADLHGTGTSTQGDWVTGVEHPIIDPPASLIGSFNSTYHIAYFPTIYMICPDRVITEVGQINATALYAAKSSCSIATVSADAEMIPSSTLNTALTSCDSVIPTFRLGNVGTSTLTSCKITYQVDGVTQKVYNWTGSVATYDNTLVTGVKLGQTPGSHSITAIVSNPNGSADPTASNNTTTASFVIYPAVGGPLITQPFETAGMPSAWPIANGGDPITWATATTGYSSSKSMMMNWYNIATAGEIDRITLDAMSLVGYTSPSMTFDLAYCQTTSASNDKLQIEVSTNCGATWTYIYSKSGAPLISTTTHTGNFIPTSASEWKHETASLAAFAGKPDVLVRFKAISGDGNNIYIDNINVTGVLGIDESSMINNVSVYPNPVTNNSTVNFNLLTENPVSIELINTLGQSVMNENLGNMNSGEHAYSLDASNLENGFYFLNITVGKNTITKKVAISK